MSREQYQKAFVIQFGPETDPAAERFEGRIEHVASGRNRSFEKLDGLHEFLASLLDETTAAAPSKAASKASG